MLVQYLQLHALTHHMVVGMLRALHCHQAGLLRAIGVDHFDLKYIAAQLAQSVGNRLSINMDATQVW